MKVNEFGHRSQQKHKHTYAPPGKRIRVRLFDGKQFVAKFKRKEGRFHYFHDHDRVRSSTIYQVSILTTDFKE